MYERKIPKTFTCPIKITREVIGGKWKLSIIFYLRRGNMRPSELQKEIPKASLRVLHEQLRELEMHGVIEKITYPTVPAKVEYALTNFGKSIFPIMDMMEKWGEENREFFENRLAQNKLIKQAENLLR